MIEHNLTIVISTFLFTMTMMPSVYLRYLPFRPVLGDETRKTLLQGYAAIFFCENILILLLIFSGIISYTLETYKYIYFFAGYAPYFALNLILICPYWAQHAFILGIQQILATTVATCAAILTLLFVDIDHFFDYIYLFFLIYITLYLLTFPLVLPFFRQIFLRFSSVSTERFWLYIAPLPFLVFYRETFHSVGDKVFALDFFISRLMLAGAAIFIALVAWRGLEHILQQAAMTERSLALLRRMNSFGAYTRSLQDKQARLAIVRHDLRHNAKMLADLIARGEDEAAIQLIQSLNYQIDATSVEHFAENTMVDSALAVYVQQAREKNIPIDVKIDTPSTFPAEIDFSLLLCNLLENAIHAEEHEAEDARAIRVRARTTGDSLFLSVENRCSTPIKLSASGLPKREKHSDEHGYGTLSIEQFTKKYSAECFTEQQDGYLRILLHLPLPVNSNNQS